MEVGGGQRENTITRSSVRFCFLNQAGKTKQTGGAKWGRIVKPTDPTTIPYRSVHQEKRKKKGERRMSFDKSSWWVAARARGSYEDSMKDARSTHEYHTTYLLPLVSERIFSFPLFHLTRRFFFCFKLDEERKRDRSDWTKNFSAHFTAQFKWNSVTLFVGFSHFPVLSVLGSFWTSFQHFY